MGESVILDILWGTPNFIEITWSSEPVSHDVCGRYGKSSTPVTLDPMYLSDDDVDHWSPPISPSFLVPNEAGILYICASEWTVSQLFIIKALTQY